jgi:hypothetical protein
MGVSGGPGYGKRVDAALRALPAMSRDNQLALAWALIDQASSLRTTRLAKAAMDAVEDLYDAEDGSENPVCPACETRDCACADCGRPCTKECAAECSSRKVTP